MKFLIGYLQQLKELLGSPEMKIFWIFLPFLAAIFVINSFYVPLLFIILTGAIAALISLIIFFYATSLARSNRQIDVEQSEQRSIIASLEDAVVAYDKNFTILFLNPAAEKLFQTTRETILGRTIAPQDAETQPRRLLAQVIFPSLAPVMIVRSEVSRYPHVVDLSFEQPALELHVATNLMLGSRGETLGFLKIIRNRTRDIAMLRSKNEFVTVASHQLRGPLTNIGWALETLQKSQNLDDSDKKLVKNTLEANHQLLNIVDDLLMTSKIEEGRFGYHFETVNAALIVSKILERALPQARAAGIQIYFDKPPADLPTIVADPEKITMAIENLLDNAIRYNVKNGEITVTMRNVSDKRFIEISIKDTGIGIPLQDIEKIFTKFYRAENAMKFETEGSGLGLYIAQNIIRAHGGEVRVESEVNRGTTFSFTLATDERLVPQKEVPLEY